jgi:Mn-dependent DtxR family transcriptional regulator
LVLQEFFEQTLGLSKEEASYNACKIEHVITDNAFNKIVDFLEKGRV